MTKDAGEQVLEWALSEVGTKTLLVSPEMAAALLTLNTGNRHLELRRVAQYAAEMKTGRWTLTGEPIIVSREGVLNDGQHRLQAVVDAGVPVWLDIRFGVSRDAFLQTGIGRKRTVADNLQIMGVKNAFSVAAVCKAMLHYETPRWPVDINRSVSPHESAEVLARHPMIQPVVDRLKAMKFAPMQASPMMFVVSLAAEVSDFETAIRFAEEINHGNEEEFVPTRALREKLIAASTMRARVPAIDWIMLGIKAWNAWIVGAQIRNLRLIASEREPENAPRMRRPVVDMNRLLRRAV